MGIRQQSRGFDQLTGSLAKNKRVAYNVAHISAGLTAMRGVEHRPIEGE